jgi:hypothetical protein
MKGFPMSVGAKAALLAALVLAGCSAGTPADAIDISFDTVGVVEAGMPVTLELHGPVPGPNGITLPSAPGLTVNGSGNNPNQSPPVATFFVTPAHAGDYTIPAFDIQSNDGKVYHVLAFTLHVTGG